MITIRRAVLDDLPEIQKMSVELTESDMRFDRALVNTWPYGKDGIAYLKKRIRGRKGICFLVVDGEGVVGYACGGILPVQKWRPVKRSELDNLYVRESYRGQGVGKQLLQEFIQWSKEQEVERVMLIAVASNDPALAFYTKQGFFTEHVMLEAKI